jgi:hypothetical protein
MAKLLGTDLGFTRADIDNLAQDLDKSVGSKLSDQERALLLAVFTAAGDHVSVHKAANAAGAAPPNPPEPIAASLHEQILSAFIPDASPADNDYCIQMRIRPAPPRTTPPG